MYAGLNRSTRVDIICPSLTNVGPIASRSAARLAAASGSPGTSSSGRSGSIPADRIRSPRPCLTSNVTSWR